MFTQIGTLLKTLPRRSKTPEAILALHVRRAFVDSLLKVCADLPNDVLATIKPSTFKNHVLTVRASNLVAAELQMRAGGLMRDINESLGRKIVYKLRFRVG